MGLLKISFILTKFKFTKEFVRHMLTFKSESFIRFGDPPEACPKSWQSIEMGIYITSFPFPTSDIVLEFLIVSFTHSEESVHIVNWTDLSPWFSNPFNKLNLNFELSDLIKSYKDFSHLSSSALLDFFVKLGITCV